MAPGLRIGLTGGIASGKSRAAEVFEALGAPVADADRIAREVVAPGTPGLETLVARFGADILAPDGTLDRARLRRWVFDDPPALTFLEGVVHPRVRAAMASWAAVQDAPYVVLVVPLLVEKGLIDLVDRVLVIDLPEPLQVARASARDGVDARAVRGIMARQAERGARLAAAHDVIRNDRGLDALEREVAALDHRYRRLAADLQGRGGVRENPG